MAVNLNTMKTLKPFIVAVLLASFVAAPWAALAKDKEAKPYPLTTCVVSGVTTCVCVSNTIRGGVESNYRMVLVSDAAAEVNRDSHEAELRTMSRAFADVKTTDEVVGSLGRLPE